MGRFLFLFIVAVLFINDTIGDGFAQAGCWNTPPAGPFIGELGRPGSFLLYRFCLSPVVIYDDGTLTSIGKVYEHREKKLLGPETCETRWSSGSNSFKNPADTWITLSYPAYGSDCPGGSAKIRVIVKDTQPPAIGLYPQYSPTTLPFIGGNVVISQDISDASGVVGVSVAAKEPNSTVPSFSKAMTLTSGNAMSGKWSTTLQVPENKKYSPVTYYFTCIARDPSGLTSEGLCGYAHVEARPDREPPAIVSYTATPNILPYTGGDVVTTVQVKDNLGVTRVSAWADKPDGSKTGVSYLKMQAGTAIDGTWSMTWPLWMNGTNQPVTWNIHVAAYDAAGNQSSSVRSVVVDKMQTPVMGKPTTPVVPSFPLPFR